MAAHSGNSATRLADDLKGDLQQTAGHLRDGATDMAGKAISTVRDYGQQGVEFVTDQAGALKKSTETLVKKNPWYAVGVALGAGVILGYMLRGRSRS